MSAGAGSVTGPVTPPLPDDVVEQLRALGSPTAEHLVDLAPHCEGAARGLMMLPWCGGCEAAHWYPALLCPGCGSHGWRWREFGSRAHLDSWTVVHHPLAPAMRGHLPLTIGLLVPVGAPHVRLVSALAVTGSDAECRLEIDQEMDAHPGPVVEGGRLLVFAPAGVR
jgi:uncharacterized OB-fold protein